MGCWCGYLSRARCRLFAYGPADQGCSGAGTHGNAVPMNILVRERRSHKCVSCKWERWCYSVPINISNLKSCTAECERGFSCMNITMTYLRSTLLIDHVASLMFINIHGPPVCRWNPQTYVNSWTVRHRDAADARTLGAVKTGEAAMEHPDPLWDIL